MKYAKEVIDLLGAYPGREFRMAELIRHVCRGRRLSARETEAVRKAVRRVLAALEEGGQVLRQADCDKSALYAWANPLHSSAIDHRQAIRRSSF